HWRRLGGVRNEVRRARLRPLPLRRRRRGFLVRRLRRRRRGLLLRRCRQFMADIGDLARPHPERVLAHAFFLELLFLAASTRVSFRFRVRSGRGRRSLWDDVWQARQAFLSKWLVTGRL